MSDAVGFVGLGTMGDPMARNLIRGGVRLVAWNRTPSKSAPVAAAGAVVVDRVAEVFEKCRIVLLMLAGERAIDEVLGRGGAGFDVDVAGHIVVHMGTTSPAYSRRLDSGIRAMGGEYVEAPVSGSRTPAEAKQLVAMVAGEPRAVDTVHPLLDLMCRDVIHCGPVPGALLMKLSVNVFLIALVVGLAEALHFAERHGLDLATFSAVLNAGPMASDVSRGKLPKLMGRDFSAQAAIGNVLENTRLITEAARTAGIASPLLDICHALYGESVALGLASVDMAAVLRAIEYRSDQECQSTSMKPSQTRID